MKKSRSHVQGEMAVTYRKIYEDMEGEAEENEALDHSDKEPEETKAEEQEETRQGETEESGVE